MTLEPASLHRSYCPWQDPTSMQALGSLAGRLSAEPQLRRLRSLLRVAHYTTGHDRLTGLPNRFLAAHVFTLRELRGQPTVIALIDLDRFKDVNDTHGHHVGDDLLRTVADRLAVAAKAHGGTAARLGGDGRVGRPRRRH